MSQTSMGKYIKYATFDGILLLRLVFNMRNLKSIQTGDLWEDSETCVLYNKPLLLSLLNIRASAIALNYSILSSTNQLRCNEQLLFLINQIPV